MVLRTNTASAEHAEQAPAAFEAMDGETEQVAQPDTTAANDAPQTPASSTSRALAPAGNSEFADAVAAMKGAIDLSYGNFKVFKGVNGEIAMTDGSIKLGRWVKGTMAGWDDHWEVSPGSQSDKAKDAVAYSKEGKVIDSVIGVERFGMWVGKSIEEYTHHLQNDGDFPKAKFARYVDVAFLVLESDTNAEMAGEVIQVTLSKTSIPSFSSYQSNLNAKAALIKRGVKNIKLPEDPFTFYFLRESMAKNGNNWTRLHVVDKLPVKF